MDRKLKYAAYFLVLFLGVYFQSLYAQGENLSSQNSDIKSEPLKSDSVSHPITFNGEKKISPDSVENKGITKVDSDSTLVSPALSRVTFNHKEQVIVGSLVMTGLALILVTMNNYNPK